MLVRWAMPRRALEQTAHEKPFDAFNRNAIACISTVTGLDDAAVLVDEKVCGHQVAGAQSGQADQTQALDQRRHAQHDGFQLAPQRTLDAVRFMRCRRRVNSDAERTWAVAGKAQYFFLRGAEDGHDIQAERRQRLVLFGQLANSAVAERTGGIAKK